MDRSSTFSSCDDGKEHKRQVEDQLVANEKVMGIFVKNDDFIKRLCKHGRYLKRERRLL